MQEAPEQCNFTPNFLSPSQVQLFEKIVPLNLASPFWLEKSGFHFKHILVRHAGCFCFCLSPPDLFPDLASFHVAVTMTTRKNSAGISRKRPQTREEPGTLVLFLADYSRTDCFRNLLFHIDSFQRLYIPADCHF